MFPNPTLLFYFLVAQVLHALPVYACSGGSVLPVTQSGTATLPARWAQVGIAAADREAVLKAEELLQKLTAAKEAPREVEEKGDQKADGTKAAKWRSQAGELRRRVGLLYEQSKHKKEWFKAIHAGDMDLVRALLDKHSVFNYSIAEDDDDGCKGYTGLLCAIHWSQVGIAILLIDRGANVNARAEKLGDDAGVTPLILAQRSPRSDEITSILLKRGADANLPQQCACQFNMLTPLMAAARDSKLSVARRLVWAGANINAVQADANYEGRNNSGRSALHWAAANGEPEIVGFLADRSANINLVANGHETPVYLAAANERFRNIKVLLKNRATLLTTGWPTAAAAYIENPADEELRTLVAACKRHGVDELVARHEVGIFVGVKNACEALPDPIAHLIAEHAVDHSPPVLDPNWSVRDAQGQLKWLNRGKAPPPAVPEEGP